MAYRTICTMEKAGIDVVDLWESQQGWWDFCEACFLYEGNPYIEPIYQRESDDKSYVEIHVIYHDENFYQLWHDEFKEIHDDWRAKTFKNLEDMGVTINRYWETTDLSAPGSRPLSEFVCKIDGEYWESNRK